MGWAGAASRCDVGSGVFFFILFEDLGRELGVGAGIEAKRTPNLLYLDWFSSIHVLCVYIIMLSSVDMLGNGTSTFYFQSQD